MVAPAEQVSIPAVAMDLALVHAAVPPEQAAMAELELDFILGEEIVARAVMAPRPAMEIVPLTKACFMAREEEADAQAAAAPPTVTLGVLIIVDAVLHPTQTAAEVEEAGKEEQVGLP